MIPILCALLAALPLAAADRDWKQNPAVAEVRAPGDIFAIGDAHSDVVRLTAVMKAAGLIDDRGAWRAGNAVLVVTGDMIDKGPRALDVLRLLARLRAEAPAHGGRVVVLAGNHEAEFLANPKAPKGAQFAAQLQSAGLSPREVADCRTDIGALLCSLPFAAIVNDWFFSHAGNTAGRTVAEIRRDIEAGFARDGYATKQLIGDDSILEARLNGAGREPWIDAKPALGEKGLLKAYTAALGVHHIVEGHVPSPVRFSDGVTRNAGEMFQRFGMLFLIDTGMSEGVGDSRGAVLHITAREATAICPDGRQALLWDSSSNQSAGRAAACK